MKSLETRFLPHPRPPHSEIFNSRREFFAGQPVSAPQFHTSPKTNASIFNSLNRRSA